MATTNLVVQIQTRGQRKLDAAHQSFGRLDKAVERVNGKLPRTSAHLNRVGTSAERASTGVSRLTRALGRAVKLFTLFQAARFILVKTSEVETQARSLEVLTGSAEKAKRVISELQGFASVTPFTSSELIEGAKRLKAYGVDTEKLVGITKRLGDVSGATGARLLEVAGVYGKVQSVGRLTGETLIQFAERGIDLQGELQRMYGLSGDEFQSAMRKGQISAEAVEVAIERLTDKGGKYADGAIAQSDTLSGKFSTLMDNVDSLARTIGEVLSPAIKYVLNEAINALNAINNLINVGRKAAKFGLDQGQQKKILDQARKEAEEIVNLRNIKDPFQRNAEFQRIAAQRESDLLDAYGYKNGLLTPEIKPVITKSKIPELLKKTNDDGGKRTGKQEQAAAEKLAAATAKRLRDSNQLLQVLEKQVQIQKEQNPLKKLQLETELDILEINQKYGNLLSEETSALVRQNLERARGLELEREALDLQEKKKDLGTRLGKDMAKMFLDQSKQNEKLTESEELTRDIARTVSSDLSRGIQGLIQGTTTLNEIASQLLSKLGGMFLDAAFSSMFKGFGIKGFAEGGSPPVNQPSIVGERGPEIFVPNVAGSVLPNDVSSAFAAGRQALAGSAGSSSAGLEGAFSDNQATLGASTAVVQRNAEAVRMQQSLSNSPVRVEVDTVRVADLDVVTLEQLQTSMAVTARQARAQVFSDMRNKPSTRSSLGMR